jgi:hypothetical protein
MKPWMTNLNHGVSEVGSGPVGPYAMGSRMLMGIGRAVLLSLACWEWCTQWMKV